MAPRVIAFVLALAVLGSFPTGAAAPADAFLPIITEYEGIRATLAADKADGIADRAKKLQELAGATLTPAGAGVPESAAAELAELQKGIVGGAAKVASAQGIEAARGAFGELSVPLVRWFELRTDPGDLAVAYCPMADKKWLQPKAPEVNNPYYGSEMLTCGYFLEASEEP
jgi:hypothetical protein